MGLYNVVDVPKGVKCVKCGASMDDGGRLGWQAKDCHVPLMCELISLDDTNEFYSECPKCKAWNHYRRKCVSSIGDFELVPDRWDA